MSDNLIVSFKDVIVRRFESVPSAARSHFPPLLQRDPFSWATRLTDQFVMVSFLGEEDHARITELQSKNFDPFPALITLDEGVGSAFRFENSQFITIAHLSVENSFVLSLGPNCSIALEDLNVSIRINELGPYSYNLPLAYVISFGEKFNLNNAHEILEDLISRSISTWREQ